MRRLGGVVGPHRHLAVLAMSAALLVVAAGVLTPLTIRHIVDHTIARRDDRLWPWLLVLLGLGVARAVGIWGRRWFGGLVSIEVEAGLRRRIHDHLQSLDTITHGALAQGQVVSRANADISTIAQLFAFGPLMASNIVLLAVAIVVMATLSPLLTLVTVGMVPLLLVAGLGYRRWAYPANLDAQNRLGELATRADEAIAGVRVVKGFGQEASELARFEEQARAVYAARLRAVRITAKWQPLLGSIPSLGVVATLGLGGWMAAEGRLSIGTFLAFVAYLQQIVAPVRFAALIVGVAQSARAGTERIFELLDGRTRIEDAPGAVPLPPGPGAVELRHVRFAYVDGDPVLDGLDLRIAPGEKVALVGGSGSGKSTAALLVPRFFDPGEGAVLVDGVDVRTVTLQSLRSRMGVVFEDPFLFSSSVRDNIAFADPTPPTRWSCAPPPSPVRTSSYARFLTVTTPSSGSRASPSPAASASVSAWRVRCSPIRRSSSSTTPPARSTSPPKRRSTTRSPRCCAAAPCCSSPIADRRSRWPTASSSWNAAASSTRAPTTSSPSAARPTGCC